MLQLLRFFLILLIRVDLDVRDVVFELAKIDFLLKPAKQTNSSGIDQDKKVYVGVGGMNIVSKG